jgi:tetratricopeptide (TPR) repeat protein
MNSSDLEFGFMLHNRGEFAQARSIYETFIRKNPKHYDAIYSLGMLHAQQNRFQVAAELFERAAKIKPSSINAHYNWGAALNMIGSHERALKSYAAVLRLNPTHADAMKT